MTEDRRAAKVELHITWDDGTQTSQTWEGPLSIAMASSLAHASNWDALFSDVPFLKPPERADCIVVANNQEHLRRYMSHIAQFEAQEE